jgi:hypothetical protein
LKIIRTAPSFKVPLFYQNSKAVDTKKLELMAENPDPHLCGPRKSREQQISSGAVSIWTSGSSGVMRKIQSFSSLMWAIIIS